MMGRFFIFILSVCFLSATASAQSLVKKAEDAYMSDKYGEAISIYQEIMQKEGVSSDLYYNMGNAYYKSGQLGKAVLFYERALLLNPNNADAQVNLDFVKTKLVDKMAFSENIVDSFVKSFRNITTPNGWSVIAIVSFLLILVAVAVYFFNGNVLLRKIGFFGGFAFIVICIVANVMAVKTAGAFEDSRFAVVMKPVSILSTSPREPKSKLEEAFVLHEGTKIELLDSVEVKIDSVAQKWFDVKADDTHRAWIKASDMEKI